MGYSVRADYLSNSFDRHFGLSCESMSLGPYVGDFFDSIQLLTHSNCNFDRLGPVFPYRKVWVGAPTCCRSPIGYLVPRRAYLVPWLRLSNDA